ncbi:hypothetical protein [Micromonospora zhanjiangensis]
MIVVQMLRVSRTADGADTTLLAEKFLKLLLTDTVAAAQMVFATTAVQSLPSFLTPEVVAGLAVGVASTPLLDTGELIDRLDLVAVWTPLHAFGNGTRRPLLRGDPSLAAARF